MLGEIYKMATKQEEQKAKKFYEKYGFFCCTLDAGMDNGEYKEWKVTFLLLTKKEKEELIKQTYRRMQLYNRKYKPKSWCGYIDDKGEEI